MRIDERVRGDIVIIEPRGRLTAETEVHFTETIRRLVDAGRTRLVLSMTDVPLIDCRGLGAIAQACITARDRGGELKLLGLTPRCRQMLTVTGLLAVLSVCGSIDEAERSFGVGRQPSPHTISESAEAGSTCAAAPRVRLHSHLPALLEADEERTAGG